jgi:hypothetical protein
MEEFVFEFNSSLAAPITQNTGWKASNKGAYYRIDDGGITSVKQASSGKWFIVLSTKGLVQGHWFNTVEEATAKADQL